MRRKYLHWAVTTLISLCMWAAILWACGLMGRQS